MSERWPGVSAAALQQLAHCGTVFRALAAIDWESCNLEHDWAATFVTNMRLFEAEMAHALDAGGWVGRSASAHAAERTTADRGS